ncbi:MULTISPECIES: hypothetical protein [Halomonadaceae]|uniref:hypothetical protein n=1 Tax=Halomonadaceae TaxID=28256 RepID=UPI0015830797|nr:MULTISPECIES: hypothetical protein [Halomonas]MDI4637871.1 hypothetical protein [Halomonas sp. BMC7]NUJ58892.1 hypothetical protein [Halomonas taeanensis]
MLRITQQQILTPEHIGDLEVATKEPRKGRPAAANCCVLLIGYLNVPLGFDAPEIPANI